MKSEIIKKLPDKQNSYRGLHTNITDTVAYNGYKYITDSEKQTIDQNAIPTKPTKTTGSWTNTDISNNKTDHASQDRNLLIISQLHHPNQEIKPKRIKENQNREICDRIKELKNLDYNHTYRNVVH